MSKRNCAPRHQIACGRWVHFSALDVHQISKLTQHTQHQTPSDLSSNISDLGPRNIPTMNPQSLHASCIPHLVRSEDLSDQILVFFKSWAIEHLRMLARAARMNSGERNLENHTREMRTCRKQCWSYLKNNEQVRHVVKIDAFHALSSLELDG